MKRADRDPLERYYTPDAVAADHVGWTLVRLTSHGIEAPHRLGWVDPCAGGGAYPRALTARYVQHGEHSDIDSGAGWPVADAMQRDYSGQVVCTNPPFSRAFDLLNRAIASEAVAVSLLLPVTALEAAKARKYWLRDRPPAAVHFIGRMRFAGPAMEDRPSGTTTTQYCYALWLGERSWWGTALTWGE
jgi:hypothetical protein